MGNPQFGSVLGPKWGKVDVLADFPSSVHLDRFSFELRQFEFDGSTGVCGRYLELQLELVSD